MDALLNLPPGCSSPGIRKLVAGHAAKDSFGEVVDAVEAVTGCVVGKRQVEELAAAAAWDFDALYAQYPAASWSFTPTALLVLSIDGKGIVVRTEDLREATRKAAIEGDGDKSGQFQIEVSRGGSVIASKSGTLPASVTDSTHYTLTP